MNMNRLPEKLQGLDLQDALLLAASVALVVGLALIYVPAALIIPSMAILALGFLRKWY